MLRFDLIKQRYAQMKIDLLVLVGGNILVPVSKYAPFLAHIPNIYLEFDVYPGDIPELFRNDNSAKVILNNDFGKTIKTALTLHPHASTLYVIAGSSPTDLFYEKMALDFLSANESKIKLSYLTGLSMQELLDQVGKIPPDSVILYLIFNQDRTGVNYYPREVLQVIREKSRAPIYGIYDSYIGHGIVGGCVISSELVGTRAGELGLRILQGERPGMLPLIKEELNVYMFDWQELKRWGIAEESLPPGSVVKNRQYTAWDLYKWYIIGGILFFIFETIVLSFLVVLIMKQKRAEERLREAEARYRTVADYAYDWEYWVSPDATIKYMSPSAERITGYTNREFVERPLLRGEIIIPEDREIWEMHIREAWGSSKSCQIQYRIRRKDGEVRWIEHACRPIEGPSGRPWGRRVSNRDITSDKTAEIALKEAEEKYRALYENAPAVYFSVSARDGTILQCNASAADLLGFSKSALIGMKVFDLFHEKTDLYESAGIFRDLLNGSAMRDVELQVIKKDGSPLWVSLSADPVKDASGRVVEIRAALMDISERKKAEAEAAQTRAELLRVERSSRLGELVASLAHELNQPLAAILSSAQAALRFLKSGKLDSNLFSTILQNIVQDDKRAAGVITSLRSMVRGEDTEKELLDVNSVLLEVLALVRGEAIIRNIDIQTELESTLSPARGHRVQLQQVVLNLIMNAAEAAVEQSTQQRRIILQTRKTDEGVRVIVRDFGPGIDREKIEDIWRPFFTTKRTGMGMGLSVSRSIIRAHGGRIWAENNADGGATFAFDIPGAENRETITGKV